MKKPWGGRFSGGTDKLVESFTESISFDRRLYAEDIDGSIAHSRMLAEQKIISKKEFASIEKGLRQIRREIEADKFVFSQTDEDIHMAIEKRLHKLIGVAAGKLHTARSRNDQVALDVRLYLKKRTVDTVSLVTDLQKALLNRAMAYRDAIVPGYTHMQRAQPVFLSHYLMAHIEMLERDKGRFMDCGKRFDLSPLGSGAMSGTTFALSRESVARELGFGGLTQNSMDAVADRDFTIEFASACSILMMHLSRFAEDMILWNTQEFRFAVLPDAFCTGSSIMPQKKNPDVLELIRGKVGRVYGDLIALLTLMKALPMTYNRDLQEDKERIFDLVDTVSSSLAVLAAMVPKIEFDRDRLKNDAAKGFAMATEIADYLAKRGVPFREAHEVSGRAVAYCERTKKELQDMSLDEYKKLSRKFEADIFDAIRPQNAVASRNIAGGTGSRTVTERLKFWHKTLGA